MTAVPIRIAKCERYLAKAAHGEGCVFMSSIAPALCTCGLEDLRQLVSGLRAGKPQAVSVDAVLLPSCGIENCDLAGVPHKHITVNK